MKDEWIEIKDKKNLKKGQWIKSEILLKKQAKIIEFRYQILKF